MALRFIIGRPRGGKSMLAVEKIIEELRTGKRQIITNVPLCLPEMAEALQDRFGETFDMLRRVRILTPEETCEFWLHPAKGVDIEGRTKLFERVGKGGAKKTQDIPDFSVREGDGGVLFVIDEVHHYFNARRWQDTGDDALYYISMHGHFGDDIYCVTQAPKNVETQFRSIAQDWTVCRNLAYERAGVFRLANKIFQATYLDLPTGAPGQSAMYSRMRPIDTKFLGRCYSTAGGTGVTEDGEADKGRLNKRPSFLWIIPIMMLIGAAVILLPAQLGPKVMHSLLGTSAVAAPVPSRSEAAAVELDKPPVAVAASAAVAPLSAPQEEDLPGRRVTGIAVVGGVATVWFDTGRRVTSRDARLQAIGERYVIWAGHRIEMD